MRVTDYADFVEAGQLVIDKYLALLSRAEAAERRVKELEAEVEQYKTILADPEAVHTNILLGRISLPDYYVRTTDTHGEFAKLKDENERLTKLLVNGYESFSTRPPCTSCGTPLSGNVDTRTNTTVCPRCGVKVHVENYV